VSEDEENGDGLNRLVEFKSVNFTYYDSENSEMGNAVTAYKFQYQDDDQQPGTPLGYSLPVTAHYIPLSAKSPLLTAGVKYRLYWGLKDEVCLGEPTAKKWSIIIKLF
jgi:hypothetical protein